MAEEEEKQEVDKKAAKRAEKARKKEEKKQKKLEKKAGNAGSTDELEEEEGTGSKLAVFLVTLVIIVIWLAILALLIKADVGGFGSSVMRPLLKDVPYLNRILPENEDDTEEVLSTEDAQYKYASMDEAVDYIKQLELELQEAQQGNSQNDAYVAELEAEVAKLRVYEENQADFEAEKEKFYEEVVFSDQAPDIDEYRQYYESIDPTNAEILYKAVVGQQEEDKEIEDYAATYASMKASEAAAIFDTMTDDLELVAKILKNMDTESAADILGKMNSSTAAKVTEIMNPSE